jgi:ABC-type antimicrobial peptide transport system permease subunit
MVLKEILVVAAIGLAIGVPLVFVASRYVKSFLYGVGPNDPLSIMAAIVALLLSGLVAAFRPAWRASQINPIIAIRHD